MADPEQAAKDTATQQRIINHMNKDHHDSVSSSSYLPSKSPFKFPIQ